MSREELINIVDAAWQKHKADVKKWLGCNHNFPSLYFTIWLGKNSIGNIGADERYVVGTLKIMGVAEDIATKYFNEVIKDNY